MFPILFLALAGFFVVLVLGALSLLAFLVLVVVNLALPLLFQRIVLFLALALRGLDVFFPHRPLCSDLAFELLFLLLVFLNQLVERGGGDIDLVQPIEFLALQADGSAQRRELVHFLHQFLGNAAQGTRDVEPELRDLLYHTVDAKAFHGLSNIALLVPRKFVSLGVRGVADRAYLVLNLREFLLDFGLGAFGAR